MRSNTLSWVVMSCLALLCFVAGVSAQHGGGGHGGGGHGGGAHMSGGGGHGSFGGSGGHGGFYSGHGNFNGGHDGHGHDGHGHDGHGHDGHFDHHHNGSFFAFYGFFGPWYPYTYWYGEPYRDWYDWDGGGYYGALAESNGTYYPPEPRQPPANRDPGKALVVVIVPDPDARVSFDGHATQQKGTERIFHSPDLESGEKLYYTIRATWSDNGHENTKEMTVTVRAGYRTVVNFIAEPTSAKTAPDKSAPK